MQSVQPVESMTVLPNPMVSDLRVAIYHNLHSGGAKRVVEEESRRLAVKHRTRVFSTSVADLAFAHDQTNLAAPISIADYRPLSMLASPFGRINPLLWMINLTRLDALSRRLAQSIDRAGFDVALIHPCQVTQTPTLVRYLQTPTLYFCHELPRRLYEPPIPRPHTSRGRLRRAFDSVDPLLNGWKFLIKYLDRASARRATRIATNSNFTRQNISMAYRRSAQVCYLGVNAAAFQPPTVERAAFVLSVGALTPAKGFDWIIRALGALPGSERPSLMLISNYQELDERKYLSELANRLAVTIIFRIGVTESELYDAYARAGCVVYAPIREPFGLVALEAMATGAPLVAVAEGGMTETVMDQVTGLLTPRDPQALGHAIHQFVSQKERARRIGENARQHVLARWTWEKHMACLENLLVETAQTSAGAA